MEGLQEVAQIMDGMLDLTRVVVQGWSYGGYMSLLALAKYPHVRYFKVHAILEMMT